MNQKQEKYSKNSVDQTPKTQKSTDQIGQNLFPLKTGLLLECDAQLECGELQSFGDIQGAKLTVVVYP